MPTAIEHRSRHVGPLGATEVTTDGQGRLLRLRLGVPGGEGPGPIAPPGHAIIHAQLSEYFLGQRTAFELPLRLSGTPFRLRVWAALQKIPFGQTLTYGELARRLGRPGAARAVGGACGDNPVPLVAPCHRVVASTGLGGWSGPPGLKEALLNLESSALGDR